MKPYIVDGWYYHHGVDGGPCKQAFAQGFHRDLQVFKKLTGIPKETQFVLSTSLHNAQTNSKQVSFGPEWVDSAIPENFHGFGADVATFNP